MRERTTSPHRLQQFIGSTFTQVQATFHLHSPGTTPASAASEIAFANPAIVCAERLGAAWPAIENEAAQPVLPRRSGALPPLWQVFRAAAQKATAPALLPHQAFVNPAIECAWDLDYEAVCERKAQKLHAFDKALAAVQTTQVESWHDHALAYFMTRQFAQALECAQQALRFDEHNVTLWRLCGAALLDLQRWPEAAHAFQRAVTLHPQDSTAWLGLGRAQFQAEDYPAALQSLGCVLGFTPAHHEALFYQGSAFFQLQQYPPACARLALAVSLKPAEVPYWRTYGEALLRDDQADAALECFEAVTQLQPTDADHWARLGSLLRELGRASEAINAYSIAVELAPQDFFLWFNRGLAQTDLRLYEDAAKSYQHALELNLTESAVKHHLALTYLPRFLTALAEGHVFNAKAHWQRAISLGRQAGSLEWDGLEAHYLQAAAAMGHQRLVKVLLARLEGNVLLEPLRHALDFVLTHERAPLEALPASLREQVERLIQRLNPPLLNPAASGA